MGPGHAGGGAGVVLRSMMQMPVLQGCTNPRDLMESSDVEVPLRTFRAFVLRLR